MPNQYLWRASGLRSRTNASTSRNAARPTTSHMACFRARFCVDAVEQQKPEGGEERRDRQQIGIGLRGQDPPPDVGDGEEGEEEGAVRQRRPGEGRRLDCV